MKGLIVVHTEMEYVDPRCMGSKEMASSIKTIFEDIAVEIERNLQVRNKVYSLFSSGRIYPAVAQHFSDMLNIPFLGFEGQFLTAKEQVVADGIDEIVVCGVSYYCCVGNIYHLFLGEKEIDIKERYQSVSKGLNWSEEKFRRIFETRLLVQIKDELTDKFFG